MDTTNPSAPLGAASEDNIRAWNDTLQALAKEFPQSIANQILPDARRAVLERLARERLPATKREVAFATLLRDAVAQPGDYKESYLPLEKLNALSRLEFGNRGTQPYFRHRVIKK